MSKISAPVAIILVIAALVIVFLSFRKSFGGGEQAPTKPPTEATGVMQNKGATK